METQFSPEVVAEMRGWLSDIMWADVEPEELAELSDAEVVAGVRRHYEGGLAAFLRDGGLS